MTRKKAVSLILVIFLVLAIMVVPMAGTGTQSNLVRQVSRGGTLSPSAGLADPAGPGMIVCDGCSGGGGGPG